jgi:hypothetical protein
LCLAAEAVLVIGAGEPEELSLNLPIQVHNRLLEKAEAYGIGVECLVELLLEEDLEGRDRDAQ